VRLLTSKISSANEGIAEKTRKIQDDHVQNLIRDDGSTKNIYLIDKKNIHNNRLQVINQYEESEGNHDTRYDVTILVNGLPLVHVELKRRGVAIREAFNQIDRYQRDSFWASCGLYEYVQVFIISNGTYTKYYSNTTRDSHIRERGEGERRRSKKTSNSFEFTSYWADATNKTITDLVDFTRTFLSKHTLLNVLTKYCVFTSESLLLVMRPYQIAATEKILSKIQIAQNYKQMGSLKAGGYVWHTTGSGKTLTSFKTAQLATSLPFIDKVLFVVDRKDLDYQTMREYDRFQKGAANSNTSTRILRRQLEDDNSKIIITTIQKLSVFIKSNKGHEVFQKHIVIIFDECHRSQFGDMHKAITKFFKKYHLFGFTGTPIFAVNAGSGGNPSLKTTPQAFGDQLHTYTIVDAINDGNVLPFHIDYINTMRMKDSLPDVEVSGINTEEALRDPDRIREIVKYILEHFDQKTKRSSFYSLQGQRVAGFNSIFAVSSIPMAKLYYSEFKRQMQEGAKKLTVATIFSFSPNEAQPDDVLPEEEFDTSGLDQTSRDFLDSAISDYNATFSVNFDTSSDKFENYYKDISMRVKNREIDLLIVVNMFLTGFDATTLNTLWVDKNLRHHGLLQAFSRTNRILNSVKTYGNVVCFRNLQKETDAAIALFGDKEAGSIVLLKRYEDYYYGYESEGTHTPGYIDLIDELLHKFPIGQPIQGEQSQKEFISLYGAILRLKNILTAFDTFEGNEILPDIDFQDYQSSYIDLYQALSGSKHTEKEKINDDIVFEIELIRQVEINIDYILMLVERYHQENCKDKDILVSIDKAVNSSIQLRSKKDLIQAFIEKVNVATNVKEDWQKFVEEQKDSELEEIIQEEKLKPEPTKRYIANSFRDGSLRTTGTDIDRIMPALSRFGAGNRGEKKQTVIQKLTRFFEKFFGIL
jgi:type I restriction enzyme R subunit